MVLQRRPARVLGAATLAGLGLLGALSGCGGAGGATSVADAGATTAAAASSGPGAATSLPTDAVRVSISGCGQGWAPTTAGEQTLHLANTDFRAGEARIVSVRDGHAAKVYADVEPFGPQTEVTVHVRLGAGSYAVECLMNEEAPLLGPVVHLTGSARGGPGVRPVDQDQIILSTWQYKTWVLGRLPRLARDTTAMAQALAAHDLTTARSAWLRAHLDYETLGAAYDAFGPLDGVINGLADGLPRGVHDPAFTGFHRIETELFGRAPSATTYADLVRRAHTLADDVRRLHGQLSVGQMDPLTLTIRAHEITENLLQTQLQGGDDYGSHSDLATVSAGLAGDAEVLHLLHRQLVQRYPETPRLMDAVRRARGLVARDLRAPWARRAVAAWPLERREELTATISGLTERLAPVASVLEPRKDD